MTSQEERLGKLSVQASQDNSSVTSQEERARAILMRLLPDHMGYAPIGSPAGTGYALAAMLALAAEVREDAAKVADERAAGRARLYEENGASINAYKAVEAEEIAAAIRAQGGES